MSTSERRYTLSLSCPDRVGIVTTVSSFFSSHQGWITEANHHADAEVAGKNVVVVGASNIVGKPMALMLLQREATVTICHAKTRDLAQHTILADILIVAAGKPGLIVPQMVKQGAIVIDVGINRLADNRIVGDVVFDGVKEKASWITPVPGGVGPMTVTMLIENTLRSAERSLQATPADDYQDWEAPVLKAV
ncbi:hypothetical protein [Azoarcus sp. L1K30]|uniref:bifunctional 5,10-methylenetetrahydrofolate dehydrogenase/5,10-methenyltetrahydrofolate cyclohydrolase n=1 Tax=Azoarcus sp. L1K30 TaxID=2820277 RepID=UPI0024AF5585|nr:hypothetical protein [Azoarcus sp. L1K30]